MICLNCRFGRGLGEISRKEKTSPFSCPCQAGHTASSSRLRDMESLAWIWTVQEIGIGAQLSGDPALIADYLAGEPHCNSH
jgi:hypothetical protein